MALQLEQLPPVYMPKTECPLYVKRYCGFLSNDLGRLVPTTGVRCQAWCKGSPDDNGQQLIDKVLPAEYQASFIARTFAKRSATEIVQVPLQWPAIEKEFAELKRKSYVKGIYLTGSVIGPQRASYKDYDVGVLVTDITAYLNDPDREATTPKIIDGVPVDLFVWTSLHPFFPALDCYSKVLFLPGWTTQKFVAIDVQPIAADISKWSDEIRRQFDSILAVVTEKTKAVKVAASKPSTARMPTEVQRKDCGCATKKKLNRDQQRKALYGE